MFFFLLFSSEFHVIDVCFPARSVFTCFIFSDFCAMTHTEVTPRSFAADVTNRSYVHVRCPSSELPKHVIFHWAAAIHFSFSHFIVDTLWLLQLCFLATEFNFSSGPEAPPSSVLLLNWLTGHSSPHHIWLCRDCPLWKTGVCVCVCVFIDRGKRPHA